MEEEMRLPIAGGETITDRENIYVLGGYSDSTQSNVAWIQKYSTFLHIWKLRTEKMHSPRYGFVADVDDEIDTVYYFGGVSESNNNVKSALETWGIINSPITNIYSHNSAFNRKFASGLLANKKLYVIGGNPEQSIAQDTAYPYIVEYSLKDSAVTFENEQIFNSSELPEQQMTCLHGDYIYIFGGANKGIKSDIYRFNITTHEFDTLNVKLSEPRAAGRAVLRPSTDQIYIIGGYNEDKDGMNSVEILNVNDNDNYSIEKGPDLNVGRSNFMAEEVNDKIYVMGGYNSDGDITPGIEILGTLPTDLTENKHQNPQKFELFQNYPNPFNPATEISYSLKNETKVRLTVYDILGNKLTELVNERQSAGTHSVTFNAEKYSSGIYVYELNAGEFQQSKKMILLR
jgi:hypothetical protein